MNEVEFVRQLAEFTPEELAMREKIRQSVLAKVDFDKRLAMVEYDEAKVTPTLLTETVTKVADVYKVSGMKTVEVFSSK